MGNIIFIYMFNIIRELCVKKNYNFQIYTNVYESDKITLITNSKIILSLPNNDAKTMNTNDLARISQIITLRGFTITEFRKIIILSLTN